MQNNLNLRSSEVISTYVYKNGSGKALRVITAMQPQSVCLTPVINLILIVSVNAVSKKVTEQSLW